VLAAAGCSSGGWLPAGRKGRLCTPDEIDDGTLVRVERTAEAERALQLADALAGLGLTDPVVATYEFAFMRDKPLFYFVAGRGHAEPRALLDDVLDAMDEDLRVVFVLFELEDLTAPEIAELVGAPVLERFGGRVRAGVEPRERSSGGMFFRCVPFDRGRGMVAISGVCAFADGGFSGYAVRTDGGNDDDALKYGAEARRFYRERSGSLAACPDRAALAARAAAPADRDAVAREAVAAVRGWKCARLEPVFPPGTMEFFAERVAREIRDPQHSALEQVCFALGNLGYPRSETMRIRVEWEREGRARLVLKGGLLDDPAPLQLVRDADGWRVDRDWALRVTQDLWTRRAVLAAAMNLQTYFAATRRFTDDGEEVTRRTKVVADFAPGIAAATSPPDRVHVAVAPDGRAACASARSRSGAILMIRVAGAADVSYGRFETPPTECPATKLDGRWAG
jgi:hypothetical protein